MKKQLLITGVCGFTGRYMCDYLFGLTKRPNVVGVDILKVQPHNCDSYYCVDLTAANEIAGIIKEIKPDFIIHLAGTFGSDDFQEVYKVNILSTTALLDAVRKYSPNAVVIIVGSAAEYGFVVPEQLPVDEQTACNPLTVYGLSKMFATQTAMYYHRIHNICTMVVRPFQLIGDGISTKLAPGAFITQLKKNIAMGNKILKVGNLESWRDFLDVRDAVEAIWMLCQKPLAGEIYNLCSGTPTKIENLLETMIQYCGSSMKIEVDASRLNRKFDIPKIYGSFQKINNHCGWQPRIKLKQSIQSLFN